MSDFSTTGELERIVCEVSLLDVFKPYFELVVRCICGIPEITLEGQAADWLNLKNKVEALEPYKLDWWLPHLREITEHFYRAALGDVDRRYWQDIYKQREAYGWARINGWIIKLVPYIKGTAGDCNWRNPLLEEDPGVWEDESRQNYMGGAGGIRTCDLPSGIAQVPFTVIGEQHGQLRHMQFLAGFFGAEQEEPTAAIRPMLGWGIRDVPLSSGILQTLPAGVVKAPHRPANELSNMIDRVREGERPFLKEFPGDFLSFYKECDGLSFESESWSWRIRPLSELEEITAPILEESTPERESASESEPNFPQDETTTTTKLGPAAEISAEAQKKRTDTLEIITRPSCWLRFLDESDGTFVAIELGDEFRICRVQATSKKARLIAFSFSDCLREFLEKTSEFAKQRQ